ncbi:hypothetical protein [Marinithermofilum abyssi]|uniref:hypothetical protein n=1 Tax=Marinithermofilum abyssi TaxID=1571185 RepID=UPI00166D6DDE|nr:hypothetical protein [Marinithermofilum abyssi]
MDRPIRCIECYKRRPGGRCDFCPLHKQNRDRYQPVGDGWYVRKVERQQQHSPARKSDSLPPSTDGQEDG